MPLLLLDFMPALVDELEQLLVEEDEPALAAQVRGLRIVDRCRCRDDFCPTFYTEPRPEGPYGRDHRNVVLNPSRGMLILDVVECKIACVEVLFRDEIRKALHEALP